MGISDIEKYKCARATKLMEAIQKIDENSSGLLFVVDDQDRLIGCLTDGDVRRWIIKNGSIVGTVGQAMHRSVISLAISQRSEAESVILKNSITAVPIVNDNNEIVDIVLRDKQQFDQDNDSLSKNAVIVMAGGKGTRLYPYTKILPKPLIPIGDIPILERIMNRFYSYGAKKFYLTVNYKKEMIRSYFSETELPYNIDYVEESQPLGTAGGISLITDHFNEPLFITNCDIITEVEYDAILNYHIEAKNDMTIVSSLKNMQVPYGVLHPTVDGTITSMEEKPCVSFFINTGLYVIEPDMIDLIPKEQQYDMTDLAYDAIKRGMRVGTYTINENAFLDMGEFEEMKRMEDYINERYSH